MLSTKTESKYNIFTLIPRDKKDKQEYEEYRIGVINRQFAFNYVCFFSLLVLMVINYLIINDEKSSTLLKIRIFSYIPFNVLTFLLLVLNRRFKWIIVYLTPFVCLLHTAFTILMIKLYIKIEMEEYGVID